jgi:DNA-binding response OmpR family regulator
MTKPLALIIEDDHKLGEIFSLSLQAAEFETELAADGQTARRRLAELQPAVVVLDLHLPFVSGETLLREIRADRRLAATRIIVTTADALLAERLRGQADLVLLKPVSPAQLRDLASRLRPKTEK